MEFLGKLGLDPKLLLAQIINFAVLLWLLKLLLFKPLGRILDERSQKAREIEEGKKKIEEEKTRFQKERKELLETAKLESAKILDDSRKRAGELERKIISEARIKAQKIISDVEKQTRAMKEEVEEEVKKELPQKVLTSLEEFFPDLITEAVQRNLFKKESETFIKDFKPGPEKKIRVITPTSLSLQDREFLETELLAKTGLEEIEEIVDKRIIAGVIFEYGGIRYDGSLRGKLEERLR